MRCWMNQGTTLRYNDVEKDIWYCHKYQFEAIELKYSMICNYGQTKMKDLVCRNNIRVGSIGALQLPLFQKEKIKQQSEKKLRNMCEYAYMLNTKYVIVFPPRGNADGEWDMIEEEAIKVLGKYSDIADEYNVKLAVEIMGFSDSCIHTIKDGLSVIGKTGRRNIGLLYDFYHTLGMGNLGRDIVEVNPEKIYIVHVNDGMKCDNGKYVDDSRLWPYDGEIGIDRQLGMLKKIGYRGPFSMEVYQSQKWAFDMQECYRIARDKMRQMEQSML